ncbi:MlaD family protein [Apibacter adventoris]|uniref:MlaD family protein n=1 Tax=Apibacter adventoris TaxID=1679466 RepID=UPI000CF74ED2|nr:MlaD family protein [Apibacter adventoris]PQL95977.1 MCE family protein [Apibacter adventoris]
MKIRKEVKAGIIVIISLLAFWWLFQFLKGKNLFSDQNIYYVKYNNVEGLSKSKNVNINGLKVGMIESITPIPAGNKNISFIVEIKVDKTYTFSKNTIAQISSSFMNGAEINLILAEDNADIAKSGDTLKGKIEPSLFDSAASQIKPLSNNANDVLIKLDSTLAATNKLLNDKNRQNIELALSNLNQAIKEFQLLGKNANGLISKNSSKLTSVLDHADKMLVTTNTTVQKYGTIADKLNKTDIDQSIKKLESALDNVNQLTSKINSGQGTMGKLMNDNQLYNNLSEASKNLSLLLEDLKANPKNYVHFSIFGGGKSKKNTHQLEPKNPE